MNLNRLPFLLQTNQLLQGYFALALLLFAYIAGLFLAIMPIDAAQYASISREMLESGNFLSVAHQYSPYLDKPPLLFWLSALSFKILGFSSFAYRLPSVLAAFLGIYATYRLAKLLYDPATARLSAAILASTQAYFLFCHDIRTDTLLTALVITAIWLLAQWCAQPRWQWALAGFTALALAMLSKGPIGAVVPIWTIGMYILAGQRKRQLIFNATWLWGSAWVLLLLSAMLYGLYAQYGTKGIYFYFWEQSFGRITGENRWRNQADALFFVHTFLWAFLPYSLLAVAALGLKIKGIYSHYIPQNKQQTPTIASDILVVGGFLLTFAALSLSHYKLPHYIFVVFPLAAILTGNILAKNHLNGRFWHIFQYFIGILLCIVAALCAFGCFPDTPLWKKIGLLALLLTWIGLYIIMPNYGKAKHPNIGSEQAPNLPLAQHKATLPSYFLPTLSAIALLNIMLNSIFYPQLSQYESGYRAAILYQKNATAQPDKAANMPNFAARSYGVSSHSFDFYTQQSYAPIRQTDSLRGILSAQALALYTDQKGLAELTNAQIDIAQVDTLAHFAVTRLNIKFLNPNKRNAQLDQRFLVWLNKQ